MNPFEVVCVSACFCAQVTGLSDRPGWHSGIDAGLAAWPFCILNDIVDPSLTPVSISFSVCVVCRVCISAPCDWTGVVVPICFRPFVVSA